MEKKLYRNEHDKVLAGVSSGVAEYLQVDVTIIRLLFVLSTIFLAGGGILVYIVLWIVAPVNNDPTVKFKQFNDFYKNSPQGTTMFNSPEAFSNPYENSQQTKWNTPNAGADFSNDSKFKSPKNNETGKTIVGLVLLVLGIYFLLRQMDLVPHWFNIFHIYKLWPLAIVALGISLIFKNQRKNEWETFKKSTEEAQRSSTEKPVQETQPAKDQSGTNDQPTTEH